MIYDRDMSYILEALKKSKKERQGGETPHLHIVHGVPSYRPSSLKRGRIGIVAAGLAIMIGAGGPAYYFFFGEKSLEVLDSSKSITVRKIEIRPQFFEQEEEDSVVVQDSPFMSRTPVLTKELPQIVLIAKDKVKKVFVVSPENNEFSTSKEFLLLKYRNELPLNIQEEIPQLVFAGHTYANDPKQRMIIINNAILREGDSIDANTTLLNIVWEGVILEYKGILFKQKIR